MSHAVCLGDRGSPKYYGQDNREEFTHVNAEIVVIVRHKVRVVTCARTTIPHAPESASRSFGFDAENRFLLVVIEFDENVLFGGHVKDHEGSVTRV